MSYRWEHDVSRITIVVEKNVLCINHLLVKIVLCGTVVIDMLEES